MGGHVGDDAPGDRAAIECVLAAAGDLAEAPGELALPQSLARPVEIAIGAVEGASRLLAGRQPLARPAEDEALVGREDDAILGEPARGLDQPPPGKPAGAAMGEGEPGDGAGDGRRDIAGAGFVALAALCGLAVLGTWQLSRLVAARSGSGDAPGSALESAPLGAASEG